MSELKNFIDQAIFCSCAAMIGAVVIATVATFTAIGLSGTMSPALSVIGLS